MFRFTIRDVLWLTVVVALAVGWWLDQDRLRRQREALRTSEAAFAERKEKFQSAVQRVQTLPLLRAEAAVRVSEAELAQLVEIKQRNPAAVSDSELRRVESQLEVARLDVERVRASDEFGSAANQPATLNRP
jgi:hypothetical protein